MAAAGRSFHAVVSEVLEMALCVIVGWGEAGIFPSSV